MAAPPLAGTSTLGGAGTEPYSAPQRLRFVIHDFVSLESSWHSGYGTKMPAIKAFGWDWVLTVHAGGDDETPGRLGVRLGLPEDAPADQMCHAKCTVRLLLSNGALMAVKHAVGESASYSSVDIMGLAGRTSVINNCLVGGTLTIEIDLQVLVSNIVRKEWKPKPTFLSDMAKLFDSGDRSDVAFVVEGERMAAHSFVLAVRAPALAALCEGAAGDIPIDNVPAATFRAMLAFAYSDKFVEPRKAGARALLEAANLFGCVQLKLHMESFLAQKDIRVEEAADLLLFADALSLPQLKETATEFCAANLPAVMVTKGWKRMEEAQGLCKQVILRVHLLAQFDAMGRPCLSNGDATPVTVSELRTTLEKRGLDCDGSREILYGRSKEGRPAKRAKHDSEVPADLSGWHAYREQAAEYDAGSWLAA